MPIVGVAGGECPSDVVDGKAGPYICIFGYVVGVIKADKLVLVEGPISSYGSRSQSEIEAKGQVFIWSFIHLFRE